MITIIDYNAGNTGSIKNMIRKIGAECVVTSDPGIISNAEKLILPGVGHFDYGMKNLIQTGLINVLNQRVLIDNVPILGICLGAQLFTKKSQEGVQEGLGWFDAETVKFKFDSTATKVPHMGWNTADVYKKNSRLFADLDNEARFYFVHSYHMQASSSSDVLTYSTYGYQFISALERENIVGVQFHPEKSHRFGMKILKNFINLY